MTPECAREIADKIIDDLTDRNGLDQEWHQIDRDIQEEIRQRWVEIILTASTELEAALAEADRYQESMRGS